MKNKKMGVFLLCILLLVTGCGSNDYIKDDKDKIVIYDKTGQNLQKHIYCKPSKNTKIYELYEKYQDQMPIKLSKLPDCEDFNFNSNKTQSLWEFLFVKPIAYLILKVGNLFKSMGMTQAYLGISVMVIGLLIRFVLLPFSLKTQKQSKLMQELAPEMKKIERKYAGRTDNESMMMKSQETMALYKKYKVSPLLSCLLALIQLPLFFGFLQAIYKIPTIYEGSLFGWNLGTTPSVGIFTNHQYSFIILVILIIVTTYFSFKYTMKQTSSTAVTPGAPNQMKIMLVVMTVFIGFASFSLPTAIALYWIVTYAFIIIQTFITNFIQNRKNTNVTKEIKKLKGSRESKKIKDKLKVKEGMKYGKTK